jgi:uncharacterized circularly permuted ATP-grasp superfamily protein/uncharacterized alpha-E superfamily protein
MQEAVSAASPSSRPAGWDELVDSGNRLRVPWRRLLGTLLGMGTAALWDRAAELARASAEEGPAALLAVPNAGTWHCDAIPFLLTQQEFSNLADGLAQRAELLELVLGDLYGSRTLLEHGHLPPALVYPSRAYLRALREARGAAPGQRHLHLYAADLVRGEDGSWLVLADRTGEPAGLAHVLENRRLMARVLPELFKSIEVMQVRPFFDIWQDSLQRLVPEDVGNPGLALLTPGHADPRWFEHVVLARALGCTLVEAGDLTVRDDALWVKTLRGLQAVHVLLRRQEGATIDPLELTTGVVSGVPGLLTALRQGTVRVLNGPGAAYAEAPGLLGYLPLLSRVLTGETLRLGAVPSLWCGEYESRMRVLDNFDAWQILDAAESGAAALRPARMDAEPKAALRARIEAQPWHFAAVAPPLASFAPCAGKGETLEPRRIVLRMFLIFDGLAWRALPGGMARVLDGDDLVAGCLPRDALCKDVWVLQEEGEDIYGPGNLHMPALAIRRTPGDMPSRVADNFYWLGRYLERLETVARLARAVLHRVGRGTLLPREMPDMAALYACMVDAGMVSEELADAAGFGQTADLLLRALSRDTGIVARLSLRVRDLADTLRDRLSGEMHATIAQELRRLKGNRLLLRPGQRAVGAGLMSDFACQVLQFTATVAGYAAENMVRGGGRLFLDLGRRIERGQAVSSQLAHAFDQKPERIEAGLNLALELCDSVLTYRARYLSVVQCAPVVDLVVADESNPRALSFQLVSARNTLAVLAGGEDAPLAAMFDPSIAETRLMVADLAGADDQAAVATTLAPRLRAIGKQVGTASNAVMRQYFALLPISLTNGLS